MPPVLRAVAIAVMATFLSLPALADDDRAAVEKVIRDYYAHYTRNDYKALEPFFAAKPPRFLGRIKFLLRKRCIEIPRL